MGSVEIDARGPRRMTKESMWQAGSNQVTKVPNSMLHWSTHEALRGDSRTDMVSPMADKYLHMNNDR